MKEKLYGVEQSNHGHCYRWIYTEQVLRQCGINANEVNHTSVDIRFPIGGSNSSATYFIELKDPDEVKAFLLAEYHTDYDDPMLIDIAEGIVTIDTGDESITERFIKEFGIKDEDLTRPNGLLKDAKEMILFLKDNDIDCDIDFDNPFYGASRDIRYSELCEIYENAKEIERER